MRAVVASLRVALRQLGRRPLRSALTVLGILFGVAAVVVVIALASGARETVGAQIQSLGSNLVFVFSQPSAKSGARSLERFNLTEDDADAVRRETVASKVAVWSQLTSQVESDFGNEKVSVMGVDEHYLAVRGFAVAEGREWTPTEQRQKAKVALLGKTAVKHLFGPVDPIGQRIRIERSSFVVVGVLASKGQSPFEDQDDRVLVPMTTFRTRLAPSPGKRVQLLLASAPTAAQVPRLSREITSLLRQRHRLKGDAEDDFRVRTQAQFKEMQEKVFGILTALLTFVAAISLLVGGVGVMNVMLVSVRERTREIGIRMAIGATGGDVRAQFLLESVVLTLLGGLGGLLLAVVLAALVERLADFPVRVDSFGVAVALSTSSVVGLVFGYLPARRASRMDPIEALRHE